MRVVNTLVDRGIISAEQLNEARETKHEKRTSLHEALLRLRHVDERSLLDIMSEVLEIEVINLELVKVDLDVLKVIPEALIKKDKVLPIRFEDENTLLVAMSDATNVIISTISFYLNNNFH